MNAIQQIQQLQHVLDNAYGCGSNAGNKAGKFAASAVNQLQELTTNNNEISPDDVEMVGGAVVETTQAIFGSFRRFTDPNRTTADVVIGVCEILGKASQFGQLGGPAGAIAGSLIGSLCALTGALVGAAFETQADPETYDQFVQRHLEETVNEQTFRQLIGGVAGSLELMADNIDTLLDFVIHGVPSAMIASLGNPQYLQDGTHALGEVYTHIVGEDNIGTSNARHASQRALLLYKYATISGLRISELMILSSLHRSHGNNDSAELVLRKATRARELTVARLEKLGVHQLPNKNNHMTYAQLYVVLDKSQRAALSTALGSPLPGKICTLLCVPRDPTTRRRDIASGKKMRCQQSGGPGRIVEKMKCILKSAPNTTGIHPSPPLMEERFLAFNLRGETGNTVSLFSIAAGGYVYPEDDEWQMFKDRRVYSWTDGDPPPAHPGRNTWKLRKLNKRKAIYHLKYNGMYCTAKHNKCRVCTMSDKSVRRRPDQAEWQIEFFPNL